MKKIVSIIIVALMIVSATLPVLASASTASTPQNGDVLFSLGNLTEGTADHASGYIASQTLSNVTLDGNDICASNDQYWKYAAVYTNLERSASTKYTIEFYIKNHTTTYPWFMFSGNTYYWGHGFKYTNDSVIALTAKKTSVGSAEVENGLAAYTDHDGYTRMVVEMDGADAIAYVGGERIVLGDLSTSSSNKLNRLSLIFVGVDVEAYTSGAMLSVKDITVYQGCIADQLDSRVEFVQNGTVLKTQTDVDSGTVLNDSDFPTVTPTTEGKLVKWFIKNTNEVVSAPYTVSSDTMLEARDVGALELSDTSEAYYKDGYVLHNADFSKISSFEDTGYSIFNSSTSRTVEVKNGKLYVYNEAQTPLYMALTENCIPQAITEYTVNFDFRFSTTANTSYLAFLHGLTLTSGGLLDRVRTVDIYASYGGQSPRVASCTYDDEGAWQAISTSIKNGEEIFVSISCIYRKVDKIVLSKGENTVTFKMDRDCNKAAYEGYFGFEIGNKTAVEFNNIQVVAGASDYFDSLIWPTGSVAGDVIQNVPAEALSNGTKPVYPDPAAPVDNNEENNSANKNENDNGSDNSTDTTDNNDETTAPPVTDAPSTDTNDSDGGKKAFGCGSSVALTAPMLALALTFGCAIFVKRKER